MLQRFVVLFHENIESIIMYVLRPLRFLHLLSTNKSFSLFRILKKHNYNYPLGLHTNTLCSRIRNASISHRAVSVNTYYAVIMREKKRRLVAIQRQKFCDKFIKTSLRQIGVLSSHLQYEFRCKIVCSLQCEHVLMWSLLIKCSIENAMVWLQRAKKWTCIIWIQQQLP